MGTRIARTDASSRPSHARTVGLDRGSFWKLPLGMRAIGLKVLKNKLSEYVRLAAGGEVVLITDRDRVVAEIVPPAMGRGLMVDDAELAEAVRQGWLTPPLVGPGGDVPRQPALALATLLDDLDADRADR